MKKPEQRSGKRDWRGKPNPLHSNLKECILRGELSSSGPQGPEVPPGRSLLTSNHSSKSRCGLLPLPPQTDSPFRRSTQTSGLLEPPSSGPSISPSSSPKAGHTSTNWSTQVCRILYLIICLTTIYLLASTQDLRHTRQFQIGCAEHSFVQRRKETIVSTVSG